MQQQKSFCHFSKQPRNLNRQASLPTRILSLLVPYCGMLTLLGMMEPGWWSCSPTTSLNGSSGTNWGATVDVNINREWKQQQLSGLCRDGLFRGKMLGRQSYNKKQAVSTGSFLCTECKKNDYKWKECSLIGKLCSQKKVVRCIIWKHMEMLKKQMTDAMLLWFL